MPEQVNVQRIGAYAWGAILLVAGGTLIIGSLGGSPGETPATVVADTVPPPPEISEVPDMADAPDGALFGDRDRMGITRVSETE